MPCGEKKSDGATEAAAQAESGSTVNGAEAGSLANGNNTASADVGEVVARGNPQNTEEASELQGAESEGVYL